MNIRILWDILDMAVTVLRVDIVRIGICLAAGILLSLLSPKYRHSISAVLAVLLFHGTSYVVRWYNCPLDLPLSCTFDCTGYYQRVTLADALGLSGDYLLLWVSVAAVFLVVCGVALYLLWQILKAVRGSGCHIPKSKFKRV